MGFYKLIILVSIFFVSNSFFASKAHSQCGTAPSQWLINYDLNNPASYARTSAPKANKVFSVYAYICRDIGEQPVATAADVTALIVSANTAFAPIGFSFNVCQVIDIPDYRYRNLDEGVTMAELLDLHYHAEVINIYFTSNTAPPEGFAAMPDPNRGDYIALGTDALQSGSIQLIHQLGHFFGLYHTSGGGVFPPELANGSNCTLAGDLLCDTPADPDGAIGSNCIHQQPIFDALGDKYAPPYDNYMSFLVDEGCGCRFTNDQYNRMYNQYMVNRSYLK